MIGSGDWCVSLAPNPNPDPVSAVVSILARPKLEVESFRPEPEGREFEPVESPKEPLGREKELSGGVAVSHPG